MPDVSKIRRRWAGRAIQHCKLRIAYMHDSSGEWSLLAHQVVLLICFVAAE